MCGLKPILPLQKWTLKGKEEGRVTGGRREREEGREDHRPSPLSCVSHFVLLAVWK